jgi:hypothetical protein
MPTHFFDTHAFIKKLIAVGFTERQAETLAEEQTTLLENSLATKQDIQELTRDFKQDVQELKRDIRELEMRMTIKLGGLMIVALSVLTTIFKFT